MRDRLMAFALVTSLLVPASAWARPAPAREKGLRAAVARVTFQPPATPAVAHQRNAYLWPGLAMIAGGATLAALAATAAKKETCGVVSVGFDVIGGCVDETNKPLLWIGVGAAAGGATLMAIGGSHHQVAVGASSIKYRFRF